MYNIKVLVEREGRMCEDVYENLYHSDYEILEGGILYINDFGEEHYYKDYLGFDVIEV